MNKYQEALITIYECKGIDGIVSQFNDLQKIVDYYSKDENSKRIPKKPNEVKKRNYMFGSDRIEVLGKCPNEECDSYIFKDLNKFCSSCGQAIDWITNDTND